MLALESLDEEEALQVLGPVVGAGPFFGGRQETLLYIVADRSGTDSGAVSELGEFECLGR
jgi:hypothetical protein